MISVIVPVYNGARYLAEALQSVLDQTHRPAEIIVVDDGSSDDSAAIALNFGPPVTCIQIAHGGPAAARNAGISRAQGEWLAFLDADDLWTPEKLRLQAAALNAEPGLEAVLGMLETFISPELAEADRRRLAAPPGTQVGYHIGAMLIRRAAFLRVGSLNPALRSGEFVDWWARAIEQGLNFSILEAVVVRRRLHTQNHTLQRRESLKDYVNVARAAIERRRQGL